MPEATKITLKPGDRFTFGRYPQDAAGKKPEPVLWEVMAADERAAVAVSVEILDARPFNSREATSAWKDCEARRWLNGEFLSAAFTKEERALIQETEHNGAKTDEKEPAETETVRDRVFLLSVQECCRFFNVVWGELAEARSVRTRAAYTDYALARFKEQEPWFRGTDAFTEEGKPSMEWWLRTTFPRTRLRYHYYVSCYGSRIETSDWYSKPKGIRPALTLDLTADALSEHISVCAPAQEGAGNSGPAADEDEIRDFAVPYPGHDDYNTFHIWWNRILTDADGKRYRAAESYSTAYDWGQEYNIFLIPADYDFDHYDEMDPFNVWARAEDIGWCTDEHVYLKVIPKTNSLIWKVKGQLQRWTAPFLQGSNSQKLRTLSRLPEWFDLTACREDEKGRLRFDPERGYGLDAATGLFVWEIDGEEYFAYPETMWADGEETSSAALCFDRDEGRRNLTVAPWTEKLEGYPAIWSYPERIEADTLLLPEGLEKIETFALQSIRAIRRLIIPSTVHTVEMLSDTELPIEEVVIRGDVRRVLGWDGDAFNDCPCEKEYLELRSRLAEDPSYSPEGDTILHGRA